ncbi:unnamed protein product, partial [Callosobruchus maculatus]
LQPPAELHIEWLQYAFGGECDQWCVLSVCFFFGRRTLQLSLF